MPLLHLLRHAKSDWDGDLPDHERPLARRGMKAAPAIARHMREQGFSPTLVLCSSSRRTRQTLELLGPALSGDTTIAVEDGLYLAGAGDMLERLTAVPDGTASVLVVGHNPGMQQLAVLLARGPAAELERLRQGFPTAALATLDTGTRPWSRLRPGDGVVVDLVLPRELD